ncbi:growth hormone secretagogue receptor type 1-like [Diadema antillarum]|uniref:growth hormone secretagogue receptor type 1-like n=1 Tax=Diadema antillarum TaxID=105358 RepID=UPI003A836E0D
MSLDTTTEVIQTDIYDVEQSNSSFVDDAVQSVTIREASFEVPFLASIILIGVFGNSLVIAVYGQRAFRASNASLHILNLAAGDLFLLVVVASLHISEFYKQTWFILWRTDAQCVLHRFARFVGFNLTIFEMMTIAIDRYMAVCHPLQFRVHCTTRRTKQKIALLWVVAVIAAIPTCLNYGTKFDVTALRNTYASRSPFACRTLSYFPKWFGEGKISYISIVLFFIPITVTAVIYVIIIIYVRRNNNQFVKMSSQENTRRSHWQTARVLCAVYVVYAACYVLQATHILVQLYARSRVSHHISNAGLLSPLANSSMNPILYLIFNSRFRSAVWSLFGLSCISEDSNNKRQDRSSTNVTKISIQSDSITQGDSEYKK